ncbi:hypothetical protein NDU88_003154 [Pleurodeles waltl]|uniref:Uncharacterized protein n=1 Tax=Pleurodeles waltl TaxID=8319 RepID=A0AAV7Q8Z7_PLEWA|nr:hypothetical protein NDU88_003154 [Pleurodeles waltl]
MLEPAARRMGNIMYFVQNNGVCQACRGKRRRREQGCWGEEKKRWRRASTWRLRAVSEARSSGEEPESAAPTKRPVRLWPLWLASSVLHKLSCNCTRGYS